jgi:diamine N-acetyltransferase
MTERASSVTAASLVTLREVTGRTVRRVTSLEVSAAQEDFVAPNAVSIAGAYFEKGAWFRAVYADETPVGFVMIFDPSLPGAGSKDGLEPGDAGLWRLMIDQRFQGLGFGRRALDLVSAHVRGRPGLRRLVSSYLPGEGGPQRFYLAYGFSKTGRLRNNGREVEICLAL